MRTAAFRTLFSLAQNDPKILLAVSDISADLVTDFLHEIPERIFVEGISEGHLVGMAVGLAKQGHCVFVNTITSFLVRRALEQITINLCLENANVKLLGQGGGLIYGQQGPTHHALEDIAILRALPNMTVLVPCDTRETEAAVELAKEIHGPVYIRLGKGNGVLVSPQRKIDLTKVVVYIPPQKIVLIATGVMTQVALSVSEQFPGCGVLGVPVLKPFPERHLAELIDGCDLAVVLEEHSTIGGLSSCVAETIVRHCRKKPGILNFGTKDIFVREYGRQEELLQLHGLDAENIAASINQRLRLG